MSKTEHKYLYQTSFRDVTSNNASSGLRENVILTNTYLFWFRNMAGKFSATSEGRREVWGLCDGLFPFIA